MTVHLQDSSATFIFIQQNSTNIQTVSNLYRYWPLNITNGLKITYTNHNIFHFLVIRGLCGIMTLGRNSLNFISKNRLPRYFC